MKKNDASVKFLLFIICGIIFAYNLGSALPIIESEKFYFQSVKEMFARHDWITPYYQGQFRFQKPILFYWLVSLSYLAFGINNFAVRFPSVLFGILTVIFTFNIGRRLFDRKTGLLAAGIVATLVIFFMYSRYASPDMALTFFVVYAIYLFLKGTKDPEKGKPFFTAFFVVLGLATMTKGYVGFLLPLIVVLSFIISAKKWKLLKAINIPSGVFIILAVGLPWYIAMCLLHGDKYLNHTIAFDAIKRMFCVPNTGAGHGFLLTYLKKLFFYIPVLIVWFMPYSLFLPAAIRDAFKSKKTYSLERDSYKLILSYFLGIFIFFSLMRAKEYQYLLPLSPALGLMTARYFINLEERNMQFRSIGFNIVYILVTIVYILGLSGILYTMHHIYSSRVAVYEYAVALAPLIIILPYLRKKSTATLFAIPIAMAVLMLFLAGRAIPLFNDRALPAFTDEIKSLIKPGEKVGVGSVDISQQRIGIYMDMPIEEVNVKSKLSDVVPLHKNKLADFLTSGDKVYLVIAEDDYMSLIPDDIKSKLIIMDEREMWKTRLKRSLGKETISEVLRGKKDILKDVLRHKVYLLTNKKDSD
ncbi:MAG: glycosyltransferase family 39 protein [Candidatus Omnitrophica bacterium]|nr:glycosyltransferase family 39 protein [Candidatus Omnitrophota bacterium]